MSIRGISGIATSLDWMDRMGILKSNTSVPMDIHLWLAHTSVRDDGQLKQDGFAHLTS